MHVYKGITPPTLVTHSLSCKFTGESNLILVKGSNLLQVYRLVDAVTQVSYDGDKDAGPKPDEAIGILDEDTFIGDEMSLVAAKEEKLSKLALISEFTLDGQVTGMTKVSTMADSQNEYLLISFRYAKMVLLKWNFSTHSIETVSLHFYEKDITDSNFFEPEDRTFIISNPQGDCACLFYHGDRIAFLSFIQRDDVDESNGLIHATAANGSIDDDLHKSSPLYYPSFVLKASTLNKSIEHIIDSNFLFEYREPTLAILYQPIRSWAGTVSLHKDTVHYLVLSLDTQQKSSIAIISVQGLPYDTFQVLPIPGPIGGSLLVGTNQLIHVDATGKTVGVAVNKFSKMSTDLVLKDQSELNLKLEGCKVQFVAKTNDEMLLIDYLGDFYQVKFDADGRKVFGLNINRLDASLGGNISIPNPINIAVIDDKSIFVGSNTGDAKLLGVKRKGERLGNDEKVEVTSLNDSNTFEEDADDYDELDDLYGYETKNSTSSKNNKTSSNGPIMFYVNDTVINNGPILDMAIGKSRKSSRNQTVGNTLEIVAATGSEKSSSLTIFQKSLRPEVVSTLDLPRSEKVWSLKLQDPEFASKESSENLLDEYLITSTLTSSFSGQSFIYKIGEEITEIQKETAFKNDSATIVAATLLNDSVVVQVTETELIAYDKNFQRRKTTKSKKNIISAQLSGSTILTICDDNSLVVYAAEATLHGPKLSVVKLPKSITELSKDNVVSSTVSQSTILSNARSSSTKSNKRKRDQEEYIGDSSNATASNEETVACLFLKNGALVFFLPSDPTVSLVIESADTFPQILSSETRKTELDNIEHQPTLIKEILITKMGDKVNQNEYLFFAERTGEIHIYELFHESSTPRFVKVSNLLALQENSDKDDNNNEEESNANNSSEKFPEVTLTATPDIDGLSGVFVTGARPYWILKNAQNPIRCFTFGDSYVSHITPFNTQLVYNGFLYCCGDDTAKVCVIPKKINLDSTWPTQKQNFGETIHSLCYHETTNVYVVATSKVIPYDAIDEDETKIAGYNENVPAADSRKGSIKLLSSRTWDVIDEIELEDNEVALQVKSMKLEVSEHSKRTKEVISFGTGFYRGEDLASKGEFYIYEIIEVVPEPGKPETNRKFKLIHREKVKGAVTSLCEVAGHLLVAQGPKVVVRNLQEDNSVSPVAFLDMSMYVIEAKSMKNMLMLGDAMHSISFVGFESDPYRMVLFGRDFCSVQTTATEFIINDKKLYFAVADVQQKLHVLQYDPDDSTSLSGQRLVRRSECFIGKQVQTMKMLPMPSGTDFFTLGGSFDGSLISVIPVSEGCYRRLYVIQQQIIDKEEHNASLNPRMYRYGDTKLSGNTINRALLDYQVIDRFPALDRTRRQKLSRRLGKKAELDILADLYNLQNIMDYF